jgi:hypothetical protein
MGEIAPTITAYVSALKGGKVRKEAKPYLHELSLVVTTWNDLHEELGRLFWTASGVSNGHIPLSIWYSTESDRAQRKMLRCILPYALHDLQRAKEKGNDWVKKAREEIKWILDKADWLAEQRNNAVHSPYLYSPEGQNLRMIAADFFGHPRAKKLTGKELLGEFRWYRKCAQVLAGYAQHVRLGLYVQPYSWPQRPSLPLLQSAKGQPSRRPAK